MADNAYARLAPTTLNLVNLANRTENGVVGRIDISGGGADDDGDCVREHPFGISPRAESQVSLSSSRIASPLLHRAAFSTTFSMSPRAETSAERRCRTTLDDNVRGRGKRKVGDALSFRLSLSAPLQPIFVK